MSQRLAEEYRVRWRRGHGPLERSMIVNGDVADAMRAARQVSASQRGGEVTVVVERRVASKWQYVEVPVVDGLTTNEEEVPV